MPDIRILGEDVARIGSGELVEQLRGLRLQERGAGERRGVAREDGAETRCDLVAQEVAAQCRVGIRFVVDPRKAARSRIRIEVCGAQRDQRPQERDVGAERPHDGHRREPVRSGPAQQLQQHRLRLIVRVMGEGDEVGADFGEHGVARGARGGLDADSRRAPDLHAMHGERNLPRSARVRAEFGPRIRSWREAVMNVHGRE